MLFAALGLPCFRTPLADRRFGPTFLEVVRWRTRDAPDRAMRCRMATLQGATRLEPSDKAGIPLDTVGVWGCWRWTPGPEWERNNP